MRAQPQGYNLSSPTPFLLAPNSPFSSLFFSSSSSVLEGPLTMTEDTLKIVKDAPKLRTPDYEGPQVVEPYAYPEPVYGDTDKEAIHTNHYYAPVAPTPQEKRTCGLKRKHFVILMAVVIVAVIAAAVGGGVGGSLANKVLDVA